MSTGEMRRQLIAVYPGLRWRAKVEAMSDAQVFVIHRKFVNQGKIKSL